MSKLSLLYSSGNHCSGSPGPSDYDFLHHRQDIDFFLGPNRTEVLSFRVCCEIYLCSKQGRFPEGSPELDRSSGHSALLPRLHTEGNEGHPGGREGGEGPQTRQSYEDSQSFQGK